ncbi:XRE family transcriptional regulator [Hydrogenovibrio sp. SC-1]|uniref:helix-turn-helix domain-containing protein n=1 Tax=Hydrogenovibrio sp. SC-1 TaxID=2065820 RepID=UPI000C7CCD4B|nr:helix-turn-helix transcriptional regulator [Hydrogenovibrio sp. SC-1]PLA73490.1 XRE family transcriptional regulator [Hydrogenovibrio sp. SC-1]
MIRSNLSLYMGRDKLKMVDVAEKIGVHRNTISLLYKEEAKRIDLETLEKLCELFNCEVGDMLYIQKEQD